MADVSMALTDDTAATNNKPGDQSMASAKKKKSRHRNRKLYSDIIRQMEFYFSDANLHKDKFLQAKIVPDGWVDVDVFADFKKIKAITTDKRVLVRALSKSTVLELNPDGKQVRRKSAYVAPKTEDVDRRTVYLEPVPTDANHNYVSTLLKPCGGHIAYVSLPRFKKSGQLKGFAFAEFDSAEAADKACEIFSPSRLPTPPTETLGKFPTTNKQLESLKKRSSVNSTTDGVSPSTAGQSIVASVTNPPVQKKASRNRTTSSSTAGADDQQLANNNEGLAMAIGSGNSNKFWVISKRVWLDLKHEYLVLQKQRISALKEVVDGKNPCRTETAEAKPAGKTGQKRKQQPPVEVTAAVKPKHIKFDDDSDDEVESQNDQVATS